VPPREVPADNYAGAAIFRIGAPANKNVRAFLYIAQEQYLKIPRRERRELNHVKEDGRIFRKHLLQLTSFATRRIFALTVLQTRFLRNITTPAPWARHKLAQRGSAG
jgi:hypothetical protein